MTKKLLAGLLALLAVATLSACSNKNKEGEENLEQFKETEIVYTSVDVKVTLLDGTEKTATVDFESIDSDTVTITGYKGPDQLHTLTLPTLVQTGEDAATSTKKVVSVSDVAFYSVSALTAVVIPEGIETLGEYAFAKCVQLESITLPSTLKEMGEGVFMGSGLKTLPLPEACALTEIADRAFAECEALTEVTVPAYIKTVGESAFFACTGITKVVISEGVTTLKNQAFQNTTALASLMLPASFENTDPREDLVFSGSDVLYIENITFPADSKAADYVAKMPLSESPVVEAE